MKSVKWLAIIVVVVIVAVSLTGGKKKEESMPSNTGTSEASARRIVRDQVIAFGQELKNVSLLAPTASTDIEHVYAPYISRSLLASWAAHPEWAPGRQTSSPWPDHFDIIDIEINPDGGASVSAMLVMMTSENITTGGDAGTSNIHMQLIYEGEAWKIDQYEVLRNNEPNMVRTSDDLPQPE